VSPDSESGKGPSGGFVSPPLSSSSPSLSSPETRIIKGAEQVGNCIISLITNASKDKISSFLNVAIDKFGPMILPAYFAITRESIEKNPEFAIRIVADIQAENIQYVKQMVKGGKIEVRRFEGNIRKFVYSRTEALETSHTLQNGQPEEAVHSSDPDFVAQLSQVFDVLWQKALPSEERIREVERGEPSKKTEVLRGTEETGKLVSKYSLTRNFTFAP
jgi:hypothetical protein